MISRRLPRATRLCVLRHTAAHTSAAVPALAITPRRPARPLHTSAKTLLAAPTQQQAHTINAPFASIASSVARILPESIPQAQLPFDRDLAESVVGRTLDLARNAATAKTVEDSKAQWAMLDAQIRSELADQQHPATALTALANLVISSSSDPRRHSIAFNLYRIAFGTDPASLSPIEVSTADFTLNEAFTEAASGGVGTSTTGQAEWGDWQAAYHWAALVLQGRAPPPPGTFLLVPGEQRMSQASQSAAAFRVFAHLATQGHPRGIFGIGRHLLSTLEKNVDPTALASMPATASSPGHSLSRQETLAEVERLYLLAGEGGVEEAWFELGAIYAEGKWVRKDDKKARSFLEQGAERNSPRACQALAALITREAQAPSTPASLDLGSQHADNKTPNTAELQRALELLERGATLGSAECAFAAGMRHLLRPPPPAEESGTGPQSASLDMSLDPSTKSPQEPIDPQEKARQDHISQWGVEPNDAAASKWFDVAVQGGNTLAMMNLARMHLEGRASSTQSAGRKQQLMEASDLYSKILSKAVGPEGQRAKAMAEVQAKIAAAKGQTPAQTQSEPAMSAGSGRLDDLGIRAEEGLRLIKEELTALAQ